MKGTSSLEADTPTHERKDIKLPQRLQTACFQAGILGLFITLFLFCFERYHTLFL